MKNKMLITGGAGFIGSNAAKYFYDKGYEISIIDNLSRKGTEANLKWLEENIQLSFSDIDIRDWSSMQTFFQNNTDIKVVLHLAAQVAVTTSLQEPRLDFETNALGTFNVLECLRQYSPESILINASTNKVYGKIENVEIEKNADYYSLTDYKEGISEDYPLDFYSPYGCSKGAAEQYVRDYHRIYGIKTVNCRQSCIYGYRQFGVEDQGWVAWFIIATMLNRPLTIYGDGKQVRDLLFVTDLLALYDRIISNIDIVKGEHLNIGGGGRKTFSLSCN